MQMIIILALVYLSILTHLYVKKSKENEINYSNYQNCLRALSEYDSKLAAYLKDNGL